MAEVYIDAIWISVAFICGLIAKRINLPVLTGFLITGIVLNFFGIKDGATNNVLPVLSELGVMLLLFTIGLKIKVKQLIKPEILVTASANMVLSVISIASFILLFSYFSVSYFTNFPAYKHLDAAYPGKVLGIDYNHDRIEAFQKQGINAAWGDAINNLFWIGADFSKVRIVLLGTSDFQTNFNVLIEINKLSKMDFKVSAISHYEDEAIKFKEHHVDFVYDYKSSIG